MKRVTVTVMFEAHEEGCKEVARSTKKFTMPGDDYSRLDFGRTLNRDLHAVVDHACSETHKPGRDTITEAGRYTVFGTLQTDGQVATKVEKEAKNE